MFDKEKDLVDALYKLSDKEYQNNLYRSQKMWEDTRIIDEDKSVRWNREQVIEHNNSIEKEYRKVQSEVAEERIKLHHEAYLYFKDRWEDYKFTKEFFQRIWDKAVSECEHCDAYYDIFSNLNYILEDFYELLDLREHKDNDKEGNE